MKDILTISRKIFIKENKLTINNKIKIKNLYIVLLDSDRDIEYGDSSFDRNIIAFNESFEPIWQIEEHPCSGSPNPYMYLELKGDKLIANSWAGMSVEVNPNTGGFVPYGVDQRPW